MFSGKTEELIRRLKRTRIAGMDVEVFKPSLDTRYGGKHIVSHDQNSISSTQVETAAAIPEILDQHTQVVGIDEAQFLDDELPAICNQLAGKGLRVIVAGLDMDSGGRPFGPMPGMMAIAEEVTKLHAICVRCGAPAHFSCRLTPGDSVIMLGDKKNYEPRCRVCFEEG